MRRVFVGLAQVFVGLAAQLRNNRGRRRFGSETGANALQTGANAPAVTVYAATSELEKATERQHEINCLIAVKNQKLVALKAECNDKVNDGQTPGTNPRLRARNWRYQGCSATGCQRIRRHTCRALLPSL